MEFSAEMSCWPFLNGRVQSSKQKQQQIDDWKTSVGWEFTYKGNVQGLGPEGRCTDGSQFLLEEIQALHSLSIHWEILYILFFFEKEHYIQSLSFYFSLHFPHCVGPPHCCRARVSCPLPWCGAFGTGTGGCPWWCPCGWSSPCRRASSSGERWEMAHFLLRIESKGMFTNTTHTHNLFLDK